MGFFDDLTNMSPDYAGSMDSSPLASGAYFGYMDKCERIEAIVDRICAGETSFDVDDDITEADLREIESKVARRLGGI